MAFDAQYPYTTFNFDVVFLDSKLIVGSFSEVSGLDFTTETEDFREGGVNDFTHKFLTVTKYPNLVLKRGMTYSSSLFDWYRDVIYGIIKKKQISIILLDSLKKEVKKWTFKEAYPIKWSVGTLSATGNSIAIESIEIAHKGLVI